MPKEIVIKRGTLLSVMAIVLAFALWLLILSAPDIRREIRMMTM